ncbi:MAG: PLP-dependent transferase [Gemmatimonadales bacterium]
MHPETLAVHAGSSPDPVTGAVAVPLHLSTTFERSPDGSFPHGFSYIRDANPNRRALEQALAALEGGTTGIAFSSGMAAISALFLSLRPGDHLLAPLDAYYGTAKLLREQFGPWGLEISFADMTDLGAVRAAMRANTKLVWMETPSNPLIAVTDIAAVAALAHDAGALAACDNTWATPLLQQPLALGADVVMHATTKYIGGHTDSMGGLLVVKASGSLADRLRAIQGSHGAVPGPFDCWLALRGLRSLPARMRVHAANAAAVARFLESHAGVERVHYPGLPSDPGHDIARRQMPAFGGMLSCVVPGGRARAFDVANRLTLFTRATSLGGPESLVEHRASVEGTASRAPEGLLRISVGLEHPDDLCADLAGALR